MTIYCLPLPDDKDRPDHFLHQVEALIGLLAKTDPNFSYQAALRIDAPEDMHGLLTRLGAERMTIVPGDAPMPKTQEKKRSKAQASAPQPSGPVTLKTCAQCGRGGLLVLTKEGICRVCAMNNGRKSKADELLDQTNPPAEPVQTSEAPAAGPPVQDPAPAAQVERSFSAKQPRLDRSEPTIFTEDRAQGNHYIRRNQSPIRARKLG